MKKIVCSLADSFDLSFDSFKLHCEAKGLSRGTVDWYLILLRTFRKYVEEADLAHSPSEVTPETIRRYIRHIQLEKPKFNGANRKDATNGLASKTVSGHVKTIMTFFGYLCSEGELTVNPAAALASHPFFWSCPINATKSGQEHTQAVTSEALPFHAKD